MRDRRLLVLAVLIYVALDLSIAAMPGAFVFESADSAESTQVRARAAAETIAVPALERGPEAGLFQPPPPVDDRLASVSSTETPTRESFRSRPSRIRYEFAPPSEDPH